MKHKCIVPNYWLACVASVSSRGSESWDKSKKKMNDRGGGGERRNPSTFNLFFCFRSNFRAITRLETLATQANYWLVYVFCLS